MEDVREVGTELHRLAESEELEPFDPAKLLQRGRRGRRRRKLLAGGGAVAGVAVIALAATLLPNLGAAGNKSVVAAEPTQNPLFDPVPGVPFGEEGADQKMTTAEAARRCTLRYPDQKGSIVTQPLKGKLVKGPTGTSTMGTPKGSGEVESGTTTMYEVKGSGKLAMCTVPGGDKPSAALLAALKKDPVPTTTAGQLRACSVQLWVDLTNWNVMASDHSKRLATTSLVAVSPSGRKAVACELSPFDGPDAAPTGNTQVYTLDALSPVGDPILTPAKGSQRAELYAAGGGGGGYCPGTPCKDNYNFTGWGRVASNATTIRLELGPGPAHEVPVKDGWFAFSWVSSSTEDNVKPKLTAYDQAGNVVKVIDQP